MRKNLQRRSRPRCCEGTGTIRVAFVGALALAVLGCSAQAASLAKMPTLAQVEGVAGARCSLASSRPLVVEWDATERGQLESQLKKGLVVARYTGCTLDVLERCAHPRARYAYQAITPKLDEKRFSTADDLYAQMPLGAAKLEGKLRASGEIGLRVIVVGRHESSISSVHASDLEGDDCAHATHVVSAVSVGAFELSAGAHAEVGGSVATNATAIGGLGTADKRALTRDGDLDACQAGTHGNAPPDGCGALVRLELLPIDTRVTNVSLRFREQVCPAGMQFVKGVGCAGGTGRAIAAHSGGSDRFLVRGETVFDTTTGRTWQRAAAQRLGWETAKGYCRRVGLDAESGWRLPKRSELLTLVDPPGAAARIDGAAFPNTEPEPYWTFTEDSSSPGDVWALDFRTGQPASLGAGTVHLVRCVR